MLQLGNVSGTPARQKSLPVGKVLDTKRPEMKGPERMDRGPWRQGRASVGARSEVPGRRGGRPWAQGPGSMGVGTEVPGDRVERPWVEDERPWAQESRSLGS